MPDAELKNPGLWTRRPSFAPGQMLTADQLTTLIESQLSRSERLMRALHGPGVIFGLAVTGPNPKDRSPDCEPQLKISCGMALDRHGRLLRWPGGTLAYGDIVNRTNCAGVFTLMAHYAERRLPKGGCGPCAEQPEWIDEGVVFRLEGPTDGKCPPDNRSCPTPKGCVSLDEYICFRSGSQKDQRIDPAGDLEIACQDPAALKPVECSDIWLDPKAGIPIACVEVGNYAPEGCEAQLGFRAADQACAVRPRVFRTPLLYELIRGCQDNLARVASLSWQEWIVDETKQDWEYSHPWADFQQLFLDPDGLVITFTRPIRARTVHPASMYLTAVYWEPAADYMLTRRIPARPLPIPKDADYATRFRFAVDKDWIASEIASRSTLREGGRIELTIRGQMLRDECGNMLDAAPLFYTPKTPAKSCPGGEFCAVLSFGRPKTQTGKPKQQEQRRSTARSIKY